MEIRILELLEGAEKARGITVIIDVFRAFSLEPVVLANGASQLIAVGAIETAAAEKERDPETILIGERHGKQIKGFDYGNSPSGVETVDFRGKRVIHTTSAGTQGLLAAKHADLLLTGALINAAATARYIKALEPEIVSLVCMGWECKKNTEEDQLCAEYIRSLLEGEARFPIDDRAYQLRYLEGKKFFDPKQADVFPEADFWACTTVNRYDFAVQAVPNEIGFVMRQVVAGI